ncbi:MAG: hypothetical protein FJX15_12360 [Alphaproteobacteria bacterium]|nr:hypothetical protein [Alphaproteobacteria bacterium]MBM3624521.1 hypothetical protein [Alphaproteobacteria bacterium]MBM3642101.1 hypothetical protein [Alphaproteobacteria bacterium]
MLAYPIFFVYGLILTKLPTAVEVVKQSALLALALAVFGTVLLLWRVYNQGPVAYGQYKPSWLGALHAFAGWRWVLALIGSAYRVLNRGRPVLAGTNELLLPIYILHQAIIVVVAYQIEQTSSGMWEKYLIVMTTSAILTILICVAVIRKFRVTRLLFGMRGPGADASASLGLDVVADRAIAESRTEPS